MREMTDRDKGWRGTWWVIEGVVIVPIGLPRSMRARERLPVWVGGYAPAVGGVIVCVVLAGTDGLWKLLILLQWLRDVLPMVLGLLRWQD